MGIKSPARATKQNIQNHHPKRDLHHLWISVIETPPLTLKQQWVDTRSKPRKLFCDNTM